MKKSPVALAVFVLLFGGWLTYLGVQALHDRRPIVVSRAQLAVAQYDVEAALADGPLPTTVQVKSVYWSADDKKPAGEIRVLNLPAAQGFAGAGAYLLPLVRRGGDYEVAGLPLDPGSPGQELRPRIYPVGPGVLRQFQTIRSGGD